MKTMDRTAKKITDVLANACHVPIRDVCVLSHDDTQFKAYVHGTTWYGQHVYNEIIETWGVREEDVCIERAPKAWWPLGSTGYCIEVKYND